jgi:RND family efflux transporter MFP subunit
LAIDRDAPASGGRRIGPWIAIGIAAMAVLIGSLAAFRAFRPIDVTVVRVQAMGGVPGASAPASEVLTANGYVVARQRASVSSEIAGRLEALYVGEGSRVKQGDVMGVLRNQDQRTAVEAAHAALASAKAAHEEAKANRDQSELELKRSVELLSRGLVSQSDLDAADARAKVDRARVERTSADIQSAESNVHIADVNLEKTYIRAPFAGAVLRKEAEVGEIVSPIPSSGGLTRGAIVTMANLATLEVEVDVNEGYVSRTHEGMRAEITLDAYPNDHFPGRVRQIVPTADRQKATVLVKVGFDSLDARVLPEMGVRVSFLADALPAAAGIGADGGSSAALAAVVAVPKAAVREVDGRAVVFVVAKGVATARGVSPRPIDADRVAISSGLAPGEDVVVDAPASLKDNARVRVRTSGGDSK